MRRPLLVSVLLTTLVCFGTLGLAVGLNWSPKLGLDLAGGLSVVYKPDKPVPASTLQTVVNIMTARAGATGISQPNITTQGNDVVVQLPGINDAEKVLRILGTTAQLYFRPVLCGAPEYVAPTTTTGKKAAAASYKVPPTCPAPYLNTSTYYDASAQAYDPGPYAVDQTYSSYPTTGETQDNKNENVILPAGSGGYAPRYVLGPAEATGQIIKAAYAQVNQEGQWEVDFTLTSSGNTVFNDIAAQNYDKLVANDLDGQIVSAPVILSQSFPGSGEISGSFTETEANNLALDLQYGALPVNLSVLTSQTVSPSLGKSSLRAGLLAGLLGLLLVMAYTILYYRALGIVVLCGLVTTAALIYGLISILGASSLGLTLDLSGVTGLIVSVGITVDSYVVYFERLKDEVRAGRSVRASVDRGFKSAYRTILSADAVSLIGAIVLWWLSVGEVRGFAFMLGLSTLIDVLTAYLFTRPLVILLGRNRIFTEARHLGVARGLAIHEDRS